MKKLILSAVFTAITLTTFVSCSSDDGGSAPTEKNDFTNANYIKSIMIGKWNYKGFFSGYWVYNGDVNKGYYTFKEDNTCEFKAGTYEDVKKGTYKIMPVVGDTYAMIDFTFDDGTKDIIMLLNLEGNVVEIQNKNYREKYEKQ